MMNVERPRLYFGPVVEQPSWKWVGKDIAAFLASEYEVRYFETVEQIDSNSIVFWIKCPPDKRAAEQIYRKRLAVLFFPVDTFDSEAHIKKYSHFIDAVTMVCLHACSLQKHFGRARIGFVRHYNKYGVNFHERQSDNRTLLWIGGFQYVPYVLNRLRDIDWPHESITLLTNPQLQAARAAAARNAQYIGLRGYERNLASSGVKVVEWSEDSQRAALLSCAAAFDIKYTADFNQYHKPPTKLEKYLASGIPCAVNTDFPAVRQLAHIHALKDLPQLLNMSSSVAIRHTSEALRRDLRVESVAFRYLQLAEQAAFMKWNKPVRSLSSEHRGSP